MQLVETITVGAGGAASIEFTSIPQDADDLLLVYSMRDSSAATWAWGNLQINGDTASNYAFRVLYGTGSSVASFSGGPITLIRGGLQTAANATANTFGSSSIYIPNYTSSTAKCLSIDGVSENNATEALQSIIAGSWSGTAAIVSLKLYGATTQQYSTASLYKITKA